MDRTGGLQGGHDHRHENHRDQDQFNDEVIHRYHHSNAPFAQVLAGTDQWRRWDLTRCQEVTIEGERIIATKENPSRKSSMGTTPNRLPRTRTTDGQLEVDISSAKERWGITPRWEKIAILRQGGTAPNEEQRDESPLKCAGCGTLSARNRGRRRRGRAPAREPATAARRDRRCRRRWPH